MTTTETTEPTAEQLQAQLGEYEAQAAEAERALGAATLDGSADTGAATKQASAARDGIVRCRAALEELARRDEHRRTGEALASALAERARAYRWAAEYFTAAEEAIRAHAAAAETIRRLAELRPPGRLATIQRGLGVGWNCLMPVDHYEGRMSLINGEHEFDTGIISRTGQRFTWPRRVGSKEDPYALFSSPRLTIDQCQELRARAIELAEADEAASKGGDG